MKKVMGSKWRAAAVLLVSLALPGCVQITDPAFSLLPAQSRPQHDLAAPGLSPTPDLAPGPLSFPAVTGNRWRYRSDRIVRETVLGIELPPQATQDVREEVVDRLNKTPYGTIFVLEDGRARNETVVYRQDGTGLYLRVFPYASGALSDAVLLEDPTLTSREDEFTVLSYPVHVGKRWYGRDWAQWVVEGVDVLDLPAGRTRAFRIATGTPTNWSRHWYGDCGRVRTERYVELPMTEDGQVVGTRTIHDVETLESVVLTDCGRCSLCR